MFFTCTLPLLFRQTRSVEKSIFFCRIIIKRFILITIDNACSRYYSKVQDWCRNSCGCCPCSFCKNINVELSVEIIDDKIIKKKDTPYGYGRISSYFNALATTDTTVYYREHLRPYTLKFYLLNNQDFDGWIDTWKYN